MKTNEMLSGIELIRYSARLFSESNENIAQAYSTQGLLNIAQCHQQCGWEFYPDQWTVAQLHLAAEYGVVPEWDENENPIDKAIPEGAVVDKE